MSKSFPELLAELDGGDVADKLSEFLKKVVAGVQAHGGKGEISLKLKIEINDGGRLEVAPHVNAKIPSAALSPTEYTLGPKGQLDLFDGDPPDGKAKAAGMHLN